MTKLPNTLRGLWRVALLERFCACGRRESQCDGSRAGCHSKPWCRDLTRSVKDEFCDRCRRRLGVDGAGEPIRYGAGLVSPHTAEVQRA